MKYILRNRIPLTCFAVFIWFFIGVAVFSCNNTPTSEQSYSRAVTGATTIRTVQANGDTLIITYTPSSYTASKLDTVVRRQGSAPVDTTQVPPVDGYTETYSLDFLKETDLDPDGHGQYGNSYIDNGWFHSRPANVSAGIRGEVQLNNNRLPLEGAMTYRVQYLYVVQNQCHSFQIHGSTDGSSAILALWHINGQFVVRTNSGGSNVSQTQPTVKIEPGRIYEMRVEYKIGAPGYYRWYIDGKLYASCICTIKNGFDQWVKMGFNGGFDKNVTEAVKSDIKYTAWRIYKKN